MNSTLRPLHEGNRLQRAYHRWALPYYERMDPALRERVEAVDRYLYSRAGIVAWVGWLCGLGGLVTGLAKGLGMPWWPATGIGTLLWVGVTIGCLSAWLNPEALLAARSRRRVLFLLAAGVLTGGPAGFAFGHWLRHGRLDLELLAARMAAKFSVVAPAMLIAGAGMALIFLSLAHVSRQINQRRLERSLLMAERDAAARGAAEAQLRLLQAQIQPHFVFNTLATLQHWVDKQDPRAGPLLRELTGFLRGSTEMLGRSAVPLAEEAQAVRHYLAILQARLGERLQYEVEIHAGLAQRAIPPGLLLTLVENAVEHGLEPRIGPGRLSVRAEPGAQGWHLQVDDDGVGLPGTQVDGVGLANVRQRLRHHFGERAAFGLRPRTGGGACARIDIQEDAPT